MNTAPGLYVGEVVQDYDDHENRYRLKVRVFGIDGSQSPPKGLPWAEVTFPGAAPILGGAGDFKPYRVGDRVYVMYIGCDPDLPVVIGPAVNERGGVPAVPIGQSVEHESGVKRWTRKDREGNEIELSENVDELHVKLRSGGASITISQLGDSIVVKSSQGRVKVEADAVSVTATTAAVSGREITINADGKDVSEQNNGHVDMRSNKRIDITSGAGDGVPLAGSLLGEDEVNIGGAVDHYKGEAVEMPVGRAPVQSARVNVRSKDINLGVGHGTDKESDWDGKVPLPPTEFVTMRATTKITIKTIGMVDIQTTGLVNVCANILNMSAVISGTLQALGPLEVLAAGPLTLSSASSLTMISPNINFSMEGAIPPLIVPPIP